MRRVVLVAGLGILTTICVCACANQGVAKTADDLTEANGSSSHSQSAATKEQEIGETSRETDMTNSMQVVETTIPDISALSAGSIVDVSFMSAQQIEKYFYYESISDVVFSRMQGNSYGEDCTIPLEELAYVRVLYYGFDKQTHVGELVVNVAISDDIVDIFRALYAASYPIEKMVLVDDYGADDNLSMAANNTSSFNYRVVQGTSTLSRHAEGMAIDINPLYNPWVYTDNGATVIDPPAGAAYADRSLDVAYYIDQDDLCYQLFTEHGFTWGGDWSSSKDYQHFSKG